MKQKEDSKTLLLEETGTGNATASLSASLVRVLAGEAVTPPPVWLMRQAGRYLPEYRTLRAKAGSFLELCLSPVLATEITLQPVTRFDLDAAILFSDILVVPYALGRKVRFIEGEGPRLDPIDEEGIDALQKDCGERFNPVLETVARVRATLGRSKVLIGFCGAPWTVATYMIAGQATADQAPARLMAATRPNLLQKLTDRLVETSATYLIAQLRAGADVVQIFDSWAGILNDSDFDRFVIDPTAKIVHSVRAAVPAAKIIGFPKGAGLRLERYVSMTKVDAIGLDWTTPLDYARDRLQAKVAVQGNLDPVVLLAGGGPLDEAIDVILATLGRGRFIFNLGHGILPETPVAHVERLVERVKSWRP